MKGQPGSNMLDNHIWCLYHPWGTSDVPYHDGIQARNPTKKVTSRDFSMQMKAIRLHHFTIQNRSYSQVKESNIFSSLKAPKELVRVFFDNMLCYIVLNTSQKMLPKPSNGAWKCHSRFVLFGGGISLWPFLHRNKFLIWWFVEDPHKECICIYLSSKIWWTSFKNWHFPCH